MQMFRPDQLELEDHIAELGMYLDSKKRIFIVEGKSDLEFFNILMATTKNKITPFVIGEKSRNSAREEIINLFNNFSVIQNNPDVLGIIDKDFNDANPPSYYNLKQTEFCDLDCYYIFGSNFLNFVIQLVCHDKIIKKLEFNPGEDIDYFREFLLIALLPLTQMRFINGDLKIPFNKLLKKSPIEERKERYKKLLKFLDGKFAVDINSFHRYFASTSHNSGLTLKELMEAIEKVKVESRMHVTNGHDLISLLTAIIKVNQRDYDDIKTEQALKLSMNLNTFDEFVLTKSVKEWIMGVSADQGKVIS